MLGAGASWTPGSSPSSLALGSPGLSGQRGLARWGPGVLARWGLSSQSAQALHIVVSRDLSLRGRW